MKIDKLNLDNLYKNGKGRRCGKHNKYLVFQKYGIKVVYDLWTELYILIGTGLDPDECDWIYWYKNEKENAGNVFLYDENDNVSMLGSGSHIWFIDNDNLKLCLQ